MHNSSKCTGLQVERSEFKTRSGHCVVFLSKTPSSHSVSLYPGVYMGISKLSGKPDEMLGETLGWTNIPIGSSTDFFLRVKWPPRHSPVSIIVSLMLPVILINFAF